MTQPFGIDRDKIKDATQGIDIDLCTPGKILEIIEDSLVPIPDCPHGWSGGGASEKKEGYTKRPMGLIPIEDNRCTKCNGEGYEVGYDDTIVCPRCNGTGVKPKSEERCTKCNGTKLQYTTSGMINCFHCKGTGKEPKTIQSCTHSSASTCSDCMEEINTKVLDSSHKAAFGKEPRKEEKDYAEFSTPEDALLCSKVMEMDDEDIFNKLSRYKEALEKIDKYGKGVHNTKYNIDPKPYEIAREALAEESTKGWVSCSTKYNTVSNTAPQEEKCLCSEPPRISHPSCPVHPISKDQQKPQDINKQALNVVLDFVEESSSSTTLEVEEAAQLLRKSL